MKSKRKKNEVRFLQRPPRIIVKFRDAVGLPYTSDEEIRKYLLEKNILPLGQLSAKYKGITINRVFTSIEPGEILKSVDKAKKINPKYDPPNFLSYCAIDCPYGVNAKALLQELRKNVNVENAYIKSPPCASPCNFTGTNPKNVKQGYLDHAPIGIDARHAWNINGGCGEGRIQFVDIEYAWILGHEDLQGSGVSFLWGDQNESFDIAHGTSVLGIVLMQDNALGGLGITPKVNAHVVSRTKGGRDSVEEAIHHAVNSLNYGDVILLELQVSDTDPPIKLWPAEIEPLIFNEIELASNSGIIVIEAAANGDGSRGYNLSRFTSQNGKKILDPTNSADFKDSGAIVVAGASPRLTNGKHGKTRSSNYGKRVNCYGWGGGVFTSDDPAQHPNECPYTEDFSGTSSASAIIAGAAVAVQSVYAASRSRGRLSPQQMRDILSNPSNGTGSRNTIGVMPDLKEIIDNVLPSLP